MLIYLIAAFWSVEAVCMGACTCGGCEVCVAGCDNGNNNGRRRVTTREQAKLSLYDDILNSDLCNDVSTKFAGEFVNDFVQTLITPGSNKPGLAALTDKMATWCGSQQQRRLDGTTMEAYNEIRLEEVARRRALGQRVNDTTRKFGWFMNFLNGNERVPSQAYKACTVYARVLEKLENSDAGSLEAEKAAVDFGAMANGDGEEKLEGCGSVVDVANGFLRSGKVPGLSVVKSEEDQEIIVVDKSSPLAATFGGMLTAVTLASGAVAMKLIELCTYFEQFKTEAPKMIMS